MVKSGGKVRFSGCQPGHVRHILFYNSHPSPILCTLRCWKRSMPGYWIAWILLRRSADMDRTPWNTWKLEDADGGCKAVAKRLQSGCKGLVANCWSCLPTLSVLRVATLQVDWNFGTSARAARVRSYQLVKGRIGRPRAWTTKTILASPQLSTSVWHFIVLEPCAWKKFNFCI